MAAQQFLNRLAIAPGLLKGGEALIVGIVNQSGLPGLLLRAGEAGTRNGLDLRLVIEQGAIVGPGLRTRASGWVRELGARR
ncbi:MAG: hypothetical protein ACOVN0_00460 [Niveispirillum sp.]|uniref:hypothetical protein n=1 Tax=Niveispirillum sp. TaxID=1917217 RepID=UPI003BA76FB8